MNKRTELITSSVNLNENSQIHSDFYLLLILVKELFIYVITFPFFLFLLCVYLILFNKEKSYYILSKLFLEPFSLISRLSSWFFEAKYTAYMIIGMSIIFILEFLIFLPLGLLDSLLFSFYDFFQGNYFSVITSLFLHADLSHLLWNMFGLLIFGRIVERYLSWKILPYAFFSGIISSLVSGYIFYLLGDQTPALGFSGAIAGIIMLSVVLEPFSLVLFVFPLFLLAWMYIYLDLISMGVSSQVNHLAHVAGYASLFVLMWFFERRHIKKIILGIGINSILLVLVYLMVNYISF